MSYKYNVTLFSPKALASLKIKEGLLANLKYWLQTHNQGLLEMEKQDSNGNVCTEANLGATAGAKMAAGSFFFFFSPTI